MLSLTLATVLFYTLSRRSQSYHADEKFEKTLTEEEQEFLAAERQGKRKESEGTYNFRDRVLHTL